MMILNLSKALNYVSKEMLSEDGLFRDNAKLLVLVILSSMSKSEPLEIEEAMNLMGRLTNQEFSQLSTAEIHVIHADPRSDRDPVEYNKQLQALQTPDRSDTKSFLHNVGLLGEANPDDPMDLQIKRDGFFLPQNPFLDCSNYYNTLSLFPLNSGASIYGLSAI